MIRGFAKKLCGKKPEKEAAYDLEKAQLLISSVPIPPGRKRWCFFASRLCYSAPSKRSGEQYGSTASKENKQSNTRCIVS